MKIDEIKKVIYNNLPMPDGCEFFGEAGHYHEYEGGIAIRRNLYVNVTNRVPDDAPRFDQIKDDIEAEIYYEQFNEELIEDFWKVIDLVFTEPSTRSSLGDATEKETFIYFSKEYAVTIRGKFYEYHSCGVIWQIDFVAVINSERV